jgi:hypothetical protein
MNPSATRRLTIGLAAAAVAYVIQFAYFVATVGVVPADAAAITERRRVPTTRATFTFGVRLCHYAGIEDELHGPTVCRWLST